MGAAVHFLRKRKKFAESGVLSTFWRMPKPIFDSGMEASEGGKENT